MSIARQPVTSTAVVSAGHDASTCDIELAGNRVYRLTGITAADFAEFMAAKSKGRAWARLRDKALTVTRAEHDDDDVTAEDGEAGIETRGQA